MRGVGEQPARLVRDAEAPRHGLRGGGQQLHHAARVGGADRLAVEVALLARDGEDQRRLRPALGRGEGQRPAVAQQHRARGPRAPRDPDRVVRPPRRGGELRDQQPLAVVRRLLLQPQQERPRAPLLAEAGEQLDQPRRLPPIERAALGLRDRRRGRRADARGERGPVLAQGEHRHLAVERDGEGGGGLEPRARLRRVGRLLQRVALPAQRPRVGDGAAAALGQALEVGQGGARVAQQAQRHEAREELRLLPRLAGYGLPVLGGEAVGLARLAETDHPAREELPLGPDRPLRLRARATLRGRAGVPGLHGLRVRVAAAQVPRARPGRAGVARGRRRVRVGARKHREAQLRRPRAWRVEQRDDAPRPLDIAREEQPFGAARVVLLAQQGLGHGEEVRLLRRVAARILRPGRARGGGGEDAAAGREQRTGVTRGRRERARRSGVEQAQHHGIVRLARQQLLRAGLERGLRRPVGRFVDEGHHLRGTRRAATLGEALPAHHLLDERVGRLRGGVGLRPALRLREVERAARGVGGALRGGGGGGRGGEEGEERAAAHAARLRRPGPPLQAGRAGTPPVAPRSSPAGPYSRPHAPPSCRRRLVTPGPGRHAATPSAAPGSSPAGPLCAAFAASSGGFLQAAPGCCPPGRSRVSPDQPARAGAGQSLRPASPA